MAKFLAAKQVNVERPWANKIQWLAGIFCFEARQENALSAVETAFDIKNGKF